MSDTRFVIAGVALIFAGIIVMGSLGHEFRSATLEADEFGTCYEYSETEPPRKTECSYKVADQALFFGGVISLVGGGVVALIKGIRGSWDSNVRPGDMVGPSDDKRQDGAAG